MAKRGTYMNQPAVPAYPVDAQTSAARDLRLVAGRFLNGRASRRDVDEMIRYWQYSDPRAPSTGTATGAICNAESPVGHHCQHRPHGPGILHMDKHGNEWGARENTGAPDAEPRDDAGGLSPELRGLLADVAAGQTGPDIRGRAAAALVSHEEHPHMAAMAEALRRKAAAEEPACGAVIPSDLAAEIEAKVRAAAEPIFAKARAESYAKGRRDERGAILAEFRCGTAPSSSAPPSPRPPPPRPGTGARSRPRRPDDATHR